VERRKEIRVKLNVKQPVILTVLGAKGNHVIEAYLLDMSGSGVQLRAPMPVSCGAAIKIESGDTLMLGEVCRCRPEAGAYTVGVQLSQELSSLTELERLNRALAGKAEEKVESDSEPRISGR
jgi:hypothetical protein